MAAKKGAHYTGQAEDIKSIVDLEKKLGQFTEKNFTSMQKLLGVSEDLVKISKTITYYI